MAQTDTGLGWSAKSEWLASAPTLIGTISTGGVTSPVPVRTSGFNPASEAEQYLYPLGVYYRLYPSNDAAYPLLHCSDSGGFPPIGAFIYIEPPNAYIVYVAETDPSTQSNAGLVVYTGSPSQVLFSASTRNTWTLNSNTGFYYQQRQLATGASYTPGTLPVFNTLQEGLDSFVGETIPIYKLNAGPSVICCAEWFNTEGVKIKSPILISSVPEYATMTADQSTPYVDSTIYSFLLEGIRFYITLVETNTHKVITPYEYADLSQFGASMPSKVFNLLANSSFSNIEISSSPDPYQEGDGSEVGGDDGEDDDADNIDFTEPPSTSIGATGLLTIFCPNLYQLQSLGNYMWSTFDVDNWRKIIANPMDAILGLHTIPVPAIVTGTKAVKVAGIDTTIDMSYTTVRYIPRPMGSCEIPKKWGAYLDYSPYTKISIFLPFIGFKELDADDIMGKTISLQYMVDILTGACVAELKCGDTVLYTWSGNCANEVPISGSDWRGAIASAIGIAATVAGTALVTGGATAPMAASMVASVGANSMNLKPTINRSGAISGSAGYMGQKRPYIIRSIPNLVIPADQNKFIGYPSFVTASLGSLTGYNEIASVHLEGIPATGNELAEIETLLKGGVIF